MSALPLLGAQVSGGWIIGARGTMTQQQFLTHVYSLADVLPERRHAIMLTRGRREFLIGFCAAQVRGQTALLPANDTDVAAEELAERYPDSYALLDVPREIDIDTFEIGSVELRRRERLEVPAIPSNHVVAILQTSGSTGQPQSHQKTWGEMVRGAQRWRRRFSIDSRDRIVATVPPQHMFGFEASIVLPLQVGASVYAGQPFYPADVADALRQVGRATLVTTPVHLRACQRSDINWQSPHRIICSTASLDAELARDCERRMQTRVWEIFGSTETGAIASRQTSENANWSCLDGLQVEREGAVPHVRGLCNGESVPLGDDIQIVDSQVFKLLGRPADMLKIGGKRASMADLNHRLNCIEGVEDGVFLRRNEDDSSADRLIAVVVAPALSGEQIRTALARQIDQVFMPRRILFVNTLTRSATGKLPAHASQALLNRSMST